MDYISDEEDQEINELANHYLENKKEMNIGQIIHELESKEYSEKVKMGIMFIIGFNMINGITNAEIHIIQPNIASTPN